MIQTDKGDYMPSETVTINGTGFAADTQIFVDVTRPSGTTFSWSILSDSSGNFVTTYDIQSDSSGIFSGTYTVTATDGVDSATTTFTDLPLILNVKVSPTSLIVFQGDFVQYDVEVNRGFPGVAFDADLSIVQSDLPANVITIFNPNPLHLGAGDSSATSTLTVLTSSTTPLGSYTFKVKAQVVGVPGDKDNSPFRTLIVVPKPVVTDQGLCRLDTNPSVAGQQFRLIYVPDPQSPTTYGLKASNPGQFAYNVFTGGIAGSAVDLSVNIPYPFVTQGSLPIQATSGATVANGCITPSGEDLTSGLTITGTSTITPSGSPAISLVDYGASPTVGSSFVTLHVTGTVPASGIVYITIHLDYGLKKTFGYGKSSSGNNAINPSTSAIIIPNLASHTFSVSGNITSSSVVKNENIFKHDPGFAGIVTLSADGNPVQDVKVRILTSSGAILATVTTDKDGFYSYNYKQTGKAANFTVYLLDHPEVLPVTVTLKANAIAVVDFHI